MFFFCLSPRFWLRIYARGSLQFFFCREGVARMSSLCSVFISVKGGKVSSQPVRAARRKDEDDIQLIERFHGIHNTKGIDAIPDLYRQSR